MKKEWIIGGIVLIVILVTGFYFFVGSNIEEEIPIGKHNIEINNFAFAPKELIIKAGETVSWVNKDSAKHTITSDNGNELNSELLSKGENYTHTFDELGNFEYHCTSHPYMVGKIVVE